MKTPYQLFGVECQSGWARLYEPIRARCQSAGVPILQVKEKFGGLRVYVGAADPALLQAIERAEQQSHTICEVCGADHAATTPGADGWLRTRCASCP